MSIPTQDLIAKIDTAYGLLQSLQSAEVNDVSGTKIQTLKIISLGMIEATLTEVKQELERVQLAQ